MLEEFWRLGLLAAGALEKIDWMWLSLDGAMTKAPLGEEKNRPQSYGSRQRRGQTQLAHSGACPRLRSAQIATAVDTTTGLVFQAWIGAVWF